ncbi:MAG: hypothetical protein GC159_22780 [Phycisphaera sp.]|nr:hypothetical protein [Phycisphaera sp.]
MGLFLRSDSKSKRKGGKAKSSTKPTKATRGKASDDAAPRHGLRMLGRLFGWTVFLAVLAVSWAYGEKALVNHLRQTRASMPQVVLVDQPAWMPPELIDQIRGTVAMTVDPDPFDRLSLQDAAVSLEVNPWVRHVVSVQRKPGGRVEVLAAYRQPVALLERKDGYYTIDQFGVRLPWVYPPMPEKIDQLGVAVIRGVRSAPPYAGQKWVGEDVQAGLKLAALVETQPWSAQVRAVDVSNYDGRIDNRLPHLQLVTDHGAVRWGRAPGDSRFYEPDAATKLRQIERVVERFNSIDANGQIVDVYTDNVMIRRAQPFQTADDRSVRYTATQ